jgi:hypothetical protein
MFVQSSYLALIRLWSARRLTIRIVDYLTKDRIPEGNVTPTGNYRKEIGNTLTLTIERSQNSQDGSKVPIESLSWDQPLRPSMNNVSDRAVISTRHFSVRMACFSVLTTRRPETRAKKRKVIRIKCSLDSYLSNPSFRQIR